MAHRLGRDMWCLLYIQTLICILNQSLQWYVQYCVILDRVIAEPDCNYRWGWYWFQAKHSHHSQITIMSISYQLQQLCGIMMSWQITLMSFSYQLQQLCGIMMSWQITIMPSSYQLQQLCGIMMSWVLVLELVALISVTKAGKCHGNCLILSTLYKYTSAIARIIPIATYKI